MMMKTMKMMRMKEGEEEDQERHEESVTEMSLKRGKDGMHLKKEKKKIGLIFSDGKETGKKLVDEAGE